MFNVDNVCTLGFLGTDDVKYVDVVSGAEKCAMLVRISRGRDSRIGPLFLVFQNCDRNFPIHNVPYDFEGVSYRTGHKSFMYQTLIAYWPSEPRVIRALPNQRRRILYIDNCSFHAEAEG